MQSEERLEHESDILRGKEAEALLNNDLLVGLIYSRKNQACEQFMSTGRLDDGKRRDAWQIAQGVISIEQDLQAIVERGKIAKTILDDQDQLKESIYNPLGE